MRGVLRWDSGRLSLESGLEGALNVLDSRNSLEEDGVGGAVAEWPPCASRSVAAKFRNRGWPLSLSVADRSGRALRVLATRADRRQHPSQIVLLPEAARPADVVWSERDRLRFLLEREVGQLDFEDFASSAFLSTSTVTAGNPDLEPDRTWRLEAAWERRFLESGTVLLSVRHERIEDLIDRIPVIAEVPFDAVGNIGDGRRSEVEINLTLPLDRFGIRAGLLKTIALWRHSEATDPTTGESRPISEDLAREAAIHFSQQLARAHVRWGIDATLASTAREHYFDEVPDRAIGYEARRLCAIRADARLEHPLVCQQSYRPQRGARARDPRWAAQYRRRCATPRLGLSPLALTSVFPCGVHSGAEQAQPNRVRFQRMIPPPTRNTSDAASVSAARPSTAMACRCAWNPSQMNTAMAAATMSISHQRREPPARP